MCNGNDCLIYLFFSVITCFAVLIYFLLKYRESFQKNNLEITVDQAWASVAERATRLNFLKSNMLFGVWQDASLTKMNLLVKDSKGQIVGQILSLMGSRVKEIKIEDKTFLIKFPLTWNRTALLHAPDAGIIAKYEKTSWLGRHEFDVAGYGVLTSIWPGLNSRAVFNYKLRNKIIGTCQQISSTREKGSLVLLPSDLPLEVRLFILTI
ncbi:MAG: hypothetical protein H7281_02535 [Bacteriovorax sp.]|nr:hypothetical protein [Bacteriovorax sp.]